MFSNNDVFCCLAVLGVTLWLLVPFIRRWSLWWTNFHSIPGHTVMQIIKWHWQLLFIKNVPDLNRVIRRGIDPYFKKHPLLRLWLGPIPVVMLCKAEATKVLLNSSSEINKPSIPYRFFKMYFGEGLATSKGAKWHQNRKLLTPGFNFGVLEGFLNVMNEQADILAQILSHKCQEMNGQTFVIHELIARCSLDILCETVMGQGVNAQMDHHCEYFTAAESFDKAIILRGMKPWFFFDWIYQISSMGKQQQHYANIIQGFVNNVIKMKKQKLAQSKILEKSSMDNDPDDIMGRKPRLVFLDLLLEQSNEGSSNGGLPLTDEDIQAEMNTFMLAGHSLTTVSIGAVLYHIGLHTHVQKKLSDELYEVYGDSNRQSTSNDLRSLKYLECVIKETLRINPVVPFVARKLNDQIKICGYTIPAGMTVAVSPYYVHRDPAQYDNPDVFDPDRFLPENSLNRDPYAFIPFSAGPRICIGQKYGMMEVKVIVATILRRFKVAVLEPDAISGLFYTTEAIQYKFTPKVSQSMTSP